MKNKIARFINSVKLRYYEFRYSIYELGSEAARLAGDEKKEAWWYRTQDKYCRKYFECLAVENKFARGEP